METKKPLGQSCVAVADPDQTEAQGTKKKLRGNRALPPYFKVWIQHCVPSVEEDKVAEHFKSFVIRK